jgi:potassium-transporting ATPase potassium-binding subunit
MIPGTYLESIKKQLKPAFIIFLLLTLITGIIYPLVFTAVAQVAFPHQANGNLIVHDGKVVGSEQIGQPFSSSSYFWGRPSATAPTPYNPNPSTGSNLGPTNPALFSEVQSRIDALHESDPGYTIPVPVDLVTSSGSGLDPHISPAAAYYQAGRVARERNLAVKDINSLISQQTEGPQFGIFGEPRVNVLKLNLALDDLSAGRITVPATEVPGNQPAVTILGIKTTDWIWLILFGVVLAFLIVPVGRFMARVFKGEPTILTPVTGPFEAWIYRISGINTAEEMDWKAFVVAMLIFHAIGIGAVFSFESLQQFLPLNPAGSGAVPWDLALNTAVSFATNTNWQAYAGETTMSYLTQMMALAVQNFLSASAGIAIVIALMYAFTRKSTDKLGNYWVLIVRGVIILLPIAFVVSLVLVSQGAVQTFNGPVTVPLLDPVRDANGTILTAVQQIPLGPAASQISIKLLGTNGGGFFNANSAHPFENPSAFANFVEMLSILLISASLCYTFGSMVGSKRKGIALFMAMTIIFIPLVSLAIWSEVGGNPGFVPLGIDQSPGTLQPGGNMEGKELRFGIVASSFFSIVTTSTSCGAVNAMHDSFMPLGGMAQLLAIQLGEIVYGGVGSGLYGIIVFAIIAMFIAGLMVGRTPEYLGKKIEPNEMKLSTIIILIPIFVILTFTALAVLVDPGKNAVLNPGPHGFTEILYAFSSAGQNNGSAFAGLSANSLFYNMTTAIAMLFGRFAIKIVTLALAGALVIKKIVPVSEGTVRDHRPLFIIWLVFVILIIGVLSFLPALALGPIAEQLLIVTGGAVHV